MAASTSTAFGGNGVNSGGTITTLTNSGFISGGTSVSKSGNALAASGIANNRGAIGTLTNASSALIIGNVASSVSGRAFGGAGVTNFGANLQGVPATITALTNSGTISGGPASSMSGKATGGAGVSNNRGAIPTLTNNGVICGGAATSVSGLTATSGAGVFNSGTIGKLINNKGGTICGGTAMSTKGNAVGGAGFSNSGKIGLFIDNGTIRGGSASSTSGLASPGKAILSEGAGAAMGPLTDRGAILGDIEIDNQASATIAGAGGSSYGDLTGGTITIGNGDLFLGGGNLVLGDDIIANGGGGTVTNMGRLQIAAPLTIAGNFDQTAAGALDLQFAGVLTSEYGSQSISAGATLDGELNADMIDGFQFMTGETFDILNFSSLSGDFGSFSIDGHACASTATDIWTCGYGPIVEELFPTGSLDLYILRGVPEPSTWALLATGLLSLGGLGLRRRKRLLAL